jgi:hypothetical protein
MSEISLAKITGRTGISGRLMHSLDVDGSLPRRKYKLWPALLVQQRTLPANRLWDCFVSPPSLLCCNYLTDDSVEMRAVSGPLSRALLVGGLEPSVEDDLRSVKKIPTVANAAASFAVLHSIYCLIWNFTVVGLCGVADTCFPRGIL